MDVESKCSSEILITNMLSGILSVDNIHSHLLKDYNDNRLDLVVLKLIENWAVSVNNSKNVRCMFSFGGETISTEKLITVIQLLKCEKLFCQILLLLPEKTKRNLIVELCCRTITSVDDYSELRETLLIESCRSYTQNIMFKITKLSKSVLYTFSQNITNIFQCNPKILSKNAASIFCFLDSILGNIDVDRYDFDVFSVLNKTGKKCVEEILESCKSCSDGNNTQNVTGVAIQCRDLLQIEAYSSFLNHLFPMLSHLMKDFEMKEEIGDEVVVRVIAKLDHLFTLLSCNEITCTEKQTLILHIKLFLDMFRETFIVSDVVEGIGNVSICETLQTQNNFHGKGNSSMLISKWMSEENKENKFLLALECLNHTCYGCEQILSWLLCYEDLDAKDINIFINHLNGYTVNYGSPSLMKRFIDIIHTQKQTNHSNYLNYAIKQVVIRCLPFVSITSCNELLTSCKEYFENDVPLLFSSTYTRDNFQSSLNEVFNKLTCDCDDEKIFSSLSQLSIISPLQVLQELIDRIFSDTLNHSVLKSVMLNLPGLLHLDSCSEKDESKSPVIIIYAKNSYIKNKEKPTSYTNVIAIISVLIEVVPDLLTNKIYHCICDVFLFPNLTFNDTKAFLGMDVTLQIMECLLQPLYQNVMSLKYNISFCKLLLDVIDKHQHLIKSVYLMDNINKFVTILATMLSHKIVDSSEEKRPILFSIQEMLRTYSWNLSFYFYSFFASNGFKYQYMVPQSLMDFCASLDDTIFVPFESFEDEDEDEILDDEKKWTSLFEISYSSYEVASLVIEHMPLFDAEEEMCNIVESAAKILPACPSIGKAKSIMECLNNIVRKQKVCGMTEYFKDELCDEFDHHGTCFSMLVVIQSFIMYFDSLEEQVRCEKQDDIQNYIKIFLLFLQYAKEIENIDVRSYFLLYLFEQLIFSACLLGRFITSMLSLLLMDILIAILDCAKSTTKSISDQVKEQCGSILDNAEGDFSKLLERFNMQVIM